jgi:hypothetical protein
MNSSVITDKSVMSVIVCWKMKLLLEAAWQGCLLVVAMTTTGVSMTGHIVDIAPGTLTRTSTENSCCNYN